MLRPGEKTRETRQTRQGGKRRLYALFAAAFLVAAVAIFMADPVPLQSLRYIVFDFYQRIAPAPRLADSPVRIVAIDEDSLAQLGQWPWPRATMARLTDALGEAGARAIAFDVMFAEPDRTSPEQMLGWVAPEQATALSRVIEGWPTHDGQFAEALARQPTVLAATLTQAPGAAAFPLKAGIVSAGADPARFLPAFDGVSMSMPALTEAARGVGAINWTPDGDQVMRRVPLMFRQGETTAPSLALEALRVAEGETTYMIRVAGAGVTQVRVGARAIPTDARGAIWIRFRHGDPESYISAADVLSGEAARSDIEGRIILIGATAPGLMDLRATPLDAAIPGVEVHQQALEQILSGRFLTRPDIAPAVELLAAIAAVLLLAFVLPRLSAAAGATLGLVVVASILGIGVLAFVGGGYLFDPVFPAASAFLFGAGAAFYLFQESARQRAEIRDAFSHYVAPSVVRRLAAHPEQLQLGGEERDLTLLFCDVRNFTSISEGLTATELTTFINRLLTPLSDVITEAGGTIDKYMGDAIMAFWNAPTDVPDHARRACDAAVLMAAKMNELNAEWRAEAEAAGRAYVPVAIGIGVNSGECCVGNLGSYRRFDYSAIGDNVNLTSRLESLSKLYGLTLVIGEDTARRLPDLPFLEIDLVRVKGRAAPTRLFTLLSALGVEEAVWPGLKGGQDAFLAAYRAGRWDEARARLGQLQSRNVAVLERFYAMYAERIDKLAAAAPADWDGVFALDEK